MGHDDSIILKKLQGLIVVNLQEIPFGDEKTMKLFVAGQTQGIFDFYNEFVVMFVMLAIKPKTFDELIRISSFLHSTSSWNDNAKNLIRDGEKVTEIISCRKDIYLY